MDKEAGQKITLVVLAAWLMWIVLQYVTKAATADLLLQQQVQTMRILPFERVVAMAGQGFQHETVEQDGRTYWVGRAVTAIKGSPTAITRAKATLYVHYLQVAPFVPWRLGPSAELTISLKE